MTTDTLTSGPFVYVDCGARGVGVPFLRAFRRAEYVGFEPDPEECARLEARRKKRRRYFPVAVGGAAGRRRLFVTRSPACSSLLRPNRALVGRFRDCEALFEVVGEREVDTVTLDDYLPSRGIERVDVLKLDTQGSELEILQGAERLLRECVLAVRVEVEFAPLYADQPLFGDLDAHLRARGFALFDLTCYRGRRGALPAEQPTRGQVLWGQAVYLRDHTGLAGAAAGLRLAALATFYGFPDYALEILEGLPEGDLSGPDARVAERWRAALIRTPSSRWRALLRDLDQSPFRAAFRRAGAWWTGVGELFLDVTRRSAGTWRE